MPRFWLVKTEPGAYSIDDLARDGVTAWDGVRNYQARNYMRAMHPGDSVLIYHSNIKDPAVVGIAEVARAAYPDFTAWDASSKYFDPKSLPDKPRWWMVDVRFLLRFDPPVSRAKLKEQPEFAGMELLKKGSRLSVQPVSEAHWRAILSLGGRAF